METYRGYSRGQLGESTHLGLVSELAEMILDADLLFNQDKKVELSVYILEPAAAWDDAVIFNIRIEERKEYEDATVTVHI